MAGTFTTEGFAMKLRGINYGNVLGASGVQGFYGEGYRFHKMLGGWGPDFTGITFVAKTTTFHPQAGNMPLREDLTPKEFKPRCIWVEPFKKIALNAVGLSGPGAKALLDIMGPHPTNIGLFKWQPRLAPFMISFMPVAKTLEDRLEEMRLFVQLLSKHLREFSGDVALQINVSCPNVGLDPVKLIGEVAHLLDIASVLEIPLVPKFNVLVPPEAVVEMSKHPAYDATCISNTIPFGKLEQWIDWKKLFPKGSPLAKLGGGGLSGSLLLPIVADWIHRAYRAGMQKPMNVGGGITETKSVDFLLLDGLRPGIDSIFIGSVAMFRPWRVQQIIRYAEKVLAAPERMAKAA